MQPLAASGGRAADGKAAMRHLPPREFQLPRRGALCMTARYWWICSFLVSCGFDTPFCGDGRMRQARANLDVVLGEGCTMLSFDFAGSGRSEGHWVTLGWWEKDDLASVIQYLRQTERTSTIGLWGRSMGAATALLHSHRDPSIAGMILDSPFADLEQLIHVRASGGCGGGTRRDRGYSFYNHGNSPRKCMPFDRRKSSHSTFASSECTSLAGWSVSLSVWSNHPYGNALDWIFTILSQSPTLTSASSQSWLERVVLDPRDDGGWILFPRSSAGHSFRRCFVPRGKTRLSLRTTVELCASKNFDSHGWHETPFFAPSISTHFLPPPQT